jgi:hypothetical protein
MRYEARRNHRFRVGGGHQFPSVEPTRLPSSPLAALLRGQVQSYRAPRTRSPPSRPPACSAGELAFVSLFFSFQKDRQWRSLSCSQRGGDSSCHKLDLQIADFKLVVVSSIWMPTRLIWVGRSSIQHGKLRFGEEEHRFNGNDFQFRGEKFNLSGGKPVRSMYSMQKVWLGLGDVKLGEMSVA